MAKIARLQLLGPFRMSDAEGRDCTPRGAVRRALLAVLALSAGGTKSRARLQDLLWSGSDHQRGGQSLRTALSMLRADLAHLGQPVIFADEQNVRLDLSQVAVDVIEFLDPARRRDLAEALAGGEPDVLEGFNLRACGDEPFEDWLRETRAHWADRLDRALLDPPSGTSMRLSTGSGAPDDPARPEARVFGAGPGAGGIGVGLLPPILHGAPGEAVFLADSVLDQIAGGLRDFSMAQIFDYRGGEAPPDSAGPILLLRAKVINLEDKIGFTLAVYRGSGQSLIWSWPVAFERGDLGDPDAGAVARFVNQAVDRLLRTLQEAGYASGGPDEASPFHIVSTMFRLGDADLWEAQAMIDRAREDSEDPIYLALAAYLRTFRVGEHSQRLEPGLVDETADLLDRFTAEPCFSGVGLSMAGHAAGYVLHDLDLARALMEQAAEVNPNLAICWDHLALHHLYCGDYEAASGATARALHCGTFSPFRFAYETTECMIATLSGDYRLAAERGRRILRKRPDYGPALRYTAVSLGHAGELEEAGELLRRIRALDPEFSADRVVRDRLAAADARAEAVLRIGLEKAGA